MSTFRRYDKFFDFEKVDEGAGIVYGWAIVCTVDSEPYVDLQGDHIPVDAMLDATASFMAKFERPGLDMHEGDARGDIVFGMPITKHTRKQLGMSTDREGFYIGWKPRDTEAMSLVKNGDRMGFSIGGWIEESDDVDVSKLLTPAAGTAKPLIEQMKLLAKAKGKDKKSKEKYRMFRRFHLDEISIVDRPAQEGALIGFVKRAVIAQYIAKAAVATSSEKGHQHMVDTSCCDANGIGRTSSAETGGKDYSWHSHDWQADPLTGKITILDNAGHGHTVPEDVVFVAPTNAEGTPEAPAAVAYVTANDKSPAPTSLTSGSPTGSVAVKSHPPETNAMTPEQIAELNKRLAKAESLASMSDAEKAYLAKLGPVQGEDFVAKTASARAEILKADKVVYTSTDGQEFRASDDERLWKSVKRGDDLEKSFAEEKLARKRAEFTKQAMEDMPAYPGDVKVHAAVIEAITSGIGDAEMQKAAFEAVRAGNAAIAKASKLGGHNGVTEKKAGQGGTNGGGATTVEVIEKKFREAVEKFQTDNKLPSYENALSKATQSDQTVRALYDELEEARADERN